MKRLVLILGVLAVLAGPALAGYKDGIRAARVQDFDKALKEFEPLVEQGHSGAQFNLGVMYLHGRGVKRDFHKAFELFQKSAAQEHPGAMNNLGRIYLEGKGVDADYDAAYKWFRKAATNHVIARNNLAQMYILGHGVEKNYRKAAYWLGKAAVKGHGKSQYELGVLFFNGLGIDKNEEKGLELIRKAAEKGYHKAVNFLHKYDREKRAEKRKAEIASTRYHCPKIPPVSGWGDVGHGDIINEVSRKHMRNWDAYGNKWGRHLKRMKKTKAEGKGIKMRKSGVDVSMGEFREPGAIGKEHVTLGGADLDSYIVKVTKRINVHKCLALEMSTRQAAKKKEKKEEKAN